MLLLSLTGVTKDIVDGAKEAVNSSVETAKEAYENTVNRAKNLVGIETDTEEPESDGETPRDGVGITTIDADSEPDEVITVDTEDLQTYLEARKEYVFEFSEPRLTPSEYLADERYVALSAWAIANTASDSEDYNGMQFAVTYRVIRDGEVFDTSRRRTKRLDFGSELRLEDDLRAKVRDLERIARQDYDNVFLDNHAVIVTQTDT